MTALEHHRQAVLQAPPGAGKTTRVPLAMLENGLTTGRILMLEPRRLATRAAAERMATTLGEAVGQRVGYRIKGDSKTGIYTQIEVVTEGILTRMIQSDPELAGIGAIIFDEFHERSLQADLGLALCLEIRQALRSDLILLVMSATLDAEPVAELMGGAPVITSMGTSFEVQTHWLTKPVVRSGPKARRFEHALADLVIHAAAKTEGDMLVFVPGQGEIRRTEALLRPQLPVTTDLRPLFGAMDFKSQRRAIAPSSGGRKIVLATAIAETSLTIEGLRVVVDGGLARRARFDPNSGMSRLITERVTKAEAKQRLGRAGRTAEGHCYRLWTKGEDGGLKAHAPPEIECADMASLVLDLALWGATDLSALPFLTTPNAGAVGAARDLLQRLGALDSKGGVTGHGKRMAGLPLHPRLAHMVLLGGKDAPLLAALLADRDPLTGSAAPVDLDLRVAALRHPKRFVSDQGFGLNCHAADRINAEARRIRAVGSKTKGTGVMAALAYPDRIGMLRSAKATRYILSGGKGAVLDAGDPIIGARFIVATDLDGDRREARIRRAAVLGEAEFRVLYAGDIKNTEICEWSDRERLVQTKKQEVFGALVLSEQNWTQCPSDRIAAALLTGLRSLGLQSLNMNEKTRLWIARVQWLRHNGVDLPDCGDARLMEHADAWLSPFIGGIRTARQLGQLDILAALKARLDWQQRQDLDRLAPVGITAPTGTKLTIDYSGDQPSVSVRLQEMFGLASHPAVGPNRTPLLVNLLSPARRSLQSTSDLPGFWRSSYADVRKDMRGKYPKHPWPEDPLAAAATRRVKPRK